MTREQQISDAAQMSDLCGNRHDLDCFVAGAQWADSHPYWHKPKINDNQYDLPDKSGRYLVVHTECPGEVMEGKFLCNSNRWRIEGCYCKETDNPVFIDEDFNFVWDCQQLDSNAYPEVTFENSPKELVVK